MFGYKKKIVIVEGQKEERSIVVATIEDEKNEKQLLMGSTKRKQ
jgi:hypothetical protein